ncbi:hypothetical protein BDZ89DRAFT_1077947 [Hymenopellis radicata]|nr:hypothetical protein BDZ89DRAFT_1077947 [Hymenopellis radicata]
MPPRVDLVIVVRTLPKGAVDKSKQVLVQRSQEAERQYTRLTKELKGEGLNVVARRGEDVGEILVFVGCSDELLTKSFPLHNPCSADRIQFVHSLVTSLGIRPKSIEWDMVDSIMCIHDTDFNHKWIHAWTSRSAFSSTSTFSDKVISNQFGPTIALYFTFLKTYTNFLVVPAVLGLTSYFLGMPYSPLYSAALLLWSVTFVEWWRAQEPATQSISSEQKLETDWWRKDLRRLTSLPMILLSASLLVALLTSIFVFEASWPEDCGFSPTLLFVVLVPKFMAVYQALAKRLTQWELDTDSEGEDFEQARTKKVFSMSALVAYLGLGLSAGVMNVVEAYFLPFLSDPQAGEVHAMASSTAAKLNPKRLEEQMFAYTVTNQISNTFVEVGLPFVLRKVEAWRSAKKKDGWRRPRSVRKEVALPEYDLSSDYNEMVTQFGYVVLWSAAWPLAGPLPSSQSSPPTIGAWLDALVALTWLGAVINAALVYMFHPWTDTKKCASTMFNSTLSGLKPVEMDEYAEVKELMKTALLIALAASHGYMLVRSLVRHVVGRIVATSVRPPVSASVSSSGLGEKEDVQWSAFWEYDEGVDEIRRVVKEA